MKYHLSLKRQNFLYFIPALALLVFIGMLSTRPCDLDVFIDAALKFRTGTDIYSGPYVRDLRYYYSPLFAMLLSFFLWIPPIILKFLWMVFIVLAALRMAVLFKAYFPQTYDNKKTRIWIVSVCILSSYFILLNARATQMTVFMIWACFESMRFVSKDKALYAGMLLGLFINLKLLLLPFLVYLLFRGYFRATLYTVIAFITFLFLPSIISGWQGNLDLLNSWWLTINPGNQEHTMELETGRFSLSALLPAYVPASYFKMVLLASRLFFIALTLLFLNSKPFAKASSLLFKFRELAYLSMVIVLIFPHQGFYAFFCLVPAFTYLTYYFVFHVSELSKNKRIVTFSLYVLCLLLIFIGRDILPDNLYDWMFKYHLMTWAVIGLVALLAMMPPQEDKKASYGIPV